MRSSTTRLAIALVACLVVTGCGTTTGMAPQEPRAPSAVRSDEVPTTPAESVGSSSNPASPEPSPTPAASPTPAPTPAPVLVPLVPVRGFWSTSRSITRAQLATAIAGRGAHPTPVFVSAADLRPLAAALGVTPGRNVRAVAPATVRLQVTRSPNVLGILRAEDVTPDVRALAVGSRSLFGEQHVRALSAWPLLVAEDPGARPSSFDPAAIWTLAAGGDVMLDREVYRLAVLGRKGPDYPWNGGTAAITARTCCGAPGLAIVRGRATGHAGAVRALLRGADVAIVNLEGPAPDAFTYHPRGYVFTMDPKLLVGLRRAGIDAVSIANNHIRNAGARGITDTVRNLDRIRIKHAGAGRRAREARAPAWLTAGGLRIAFLAYNGAGGGPSATATSAGAAGLSLAAMRADIRAARRAGADVVLVMPHWGTEYTDVVTAAQRRLAAGLVAAGADIVLGSHSHWAGPLEMIRGHAVVYSMGDFVFDLQHDARTQQGIIVEATFAGRRLAQVTLHPTLILAASQPNLLDAGRGGTALLRAIERGSVRLGR